MALVGIHRLKRHAALVLDGLGGHLLRQTHERLLALGAVALGIDADVHVFIAAAVDGVIGQVLDRVERLAAAANDCAHVAAGQVHVHAAVFTRGDLDLRLDAHVLEQAADKCADARIALRLVRCRCGSGRCGRRLLLCGRSRSRSFRNGLGLLIRRLILHADDRGAGTDAEEAGLGALDDLNGNIIPVKAKLLERGGDRRLFRLAGLFQCFQHHSVLSCFPSGASAAGVCSASEAAACPSA